MDKYKELRDTLYRWDARRIVPVENNDLRALLAERDALLEALEAAMAFIDSHVADPDLTHEMCERYAELQATNYETLLAAKRQEGV